MRTAITLGFLWAGGVELLTGDDVSITEQREALRKAPAVNERFEYVEIWESDRGRTKWRKFKRAVEAPPEPQQQEQAPAKAEDSIAPDAGEVPPAAAAPETAEPEPIAETPAPEETPVKESPTTEEKKKAGKAKKRS